LVAQDVYASAIIATVGKSVCPSDTRKPRSWNLHWRIRWIRRLEFALCAFAKN